MNRLYWVATCVLPVTACARGTTDSPPPLSDFDAAVACVESRMQSRGAEYVDRYLRDDSVDLVFRYRESLVTFWVTGRTGKTVKVSRMPGADPEQNVAVMQVLDDIVNRCTPKQLGT